MTRAQRRKQNVLNAQKSTGPITDEGKDASRRNALKHGFAARVLTLPDEDPKDVEAHVSAMTDALMPDSHDELVMAHQVALDSLKLRRLQRAEDEIVTEQVRDAEGLWDLDRQDRVLGLSRLLLKDAPRAYIELMSFAEGVGHLLGRWNDLKAAFEARGCWNNLELIKDALRLHGYDPERLGRERTPAYELALLAISCSRPDHEKVEHLAAYLRQQVSPEWMGLYPGLKYAVAEAETRLRRRIDDQVALLTARHEELLAQSRASRGGAKVRALALEDTPKNRLLVRYRRSTESSLDRTLKTLLRVQAEREKADAAEAERASPSGIPNEAKPTEETAEACGVKKSYVVIDGMGYEILKESKKAITLSLKAVPAKPQPEPYLGPDEEGV